MKTPRRESLQDEMENKILDPGICAKSDFKKILCITPVINIELHCATKTDEKNLLLQQPKKKKQLHYVLGI